MRLKSKAFTLIEVLLAASLMALVGLAVFRSFANGLKLWARADQLTREAEVAIFFDKMAEDLRSVPHISGIDFKGTSGKVAFPAIVLTKADSHSSRFPEGLIDQIGAVEYRFDAQTHTVFRRQANYSYALKKKWEQEKAVVTGIDGVDFYYEIPTLKALVMKSEINGVAPLGVLLKIHFTDHNGQHQFQRYLSIPVSG